MNILEENKNGFSIVRLAGKLDSGTATDFQNRITNIIDKGEKLIAFDFSRLDYISSAGLREFLSIAKKLNKDNGKLSIFEMNENVKEIFDISGFSSIIPIFQTEEEAVSAVKE